LGVVETRWARSSVSYLEPRFSSHGRLTTLRQEVRGGVATFGVEVASDKSHEIDGRLGLGRIEFDLSERQQRFQGSRDHAVGTSVTLWSGARLHGGYAKSASVASVDEWWNASFTFRLGSHVEVSVERSFDAIGSSKTRMVALSSGWSQGANRV